MTPQVGVGRRVRTISIDEVGDADRGPGRAPVAEHDVELPVALGVHCGHLDRAGVVPAPDIPSITPGLLKTADANGVTTVHADAADVIVRSLEEVAVNEGLGYGDRPGGWVVTPHVVQGHVKFAYVAYPKGRLALRAKVAQPDPGIDERINAVGEGDPDRAVIIAPQAIERTHPKVPTPEFDIGPDTPVAESDANIDERRSSIEGHRGIADCVMAPQLVFTVAREVSCTEGGTGSATPVAESDAHIGELTAGVEGHPGSAKRIMAPQVVSEVGIEICGTDGGSVIEAPIADPRACIGERIRPVGEGHSDTAADRRCRRGGGAAKGGCGFRAEGTQCGAGGCASCGGAETGGEGEQQRNQQQTRPMRPGMGRSIHHGVLLGVMVGPAVADND